MEGNEGVERRRQRARPRRGAARRTNRPHLYSHRFEVRRKAVQLCLEESFPIQQVAREMGVGLSTLTKWVRVHREQGEAGLQDRAGRQLAAEGGGRGQGEGRRSEASSSRLGHPEDQPVPAARDVSAGKPGDGSPHAR